MHIKRVYLEEMLFYIFWIVMLTAKGMGLYDGMFQYRLCLLISCGAIGLRLLISKQNIIEWCTTIVLSLLGIFITYRSGDKGIYIYILLIIGMKNISLKRIFVSGTVVWGSCFFFNIMKYVLSDYKGLPLVHEKLGLGPVIRWSLGYPHPNVLHITYAVLVVFILYISKYEGRKFWKLLFVLFLGNCYVFMFSISYTGFLLTIMCMVSFYYFKLKRKWKCYEKIMLISILPLCICYAIILPLLLGHIPAARGLVEIFNDITNSRFVASQVYLNQPWTLWGQNLNHIETTFALDSSFVSLLVGGGIVIFILVIFGYFTCIIDGVKYVRKNELAVILPFLVAGVSEPFLFNTSFKNLSLLFIGDFLWRKLGSLHLNGIGIFATKKYGLISVKDSYFSISMDKLENVVMIIKSRIKHKKKYIIAFGCMLGIATILVAGICVKGPDSIYVAVGNCDCGEREVVHLDMDNLPSGFNGLVYEYRNPDTPLYEFEGILITVEIMRKVISFGIIGCACGSILAIIYFLFINNHGKRAYG